MSVWRPIETAPYGVEVEVRLAFRREPLRAILCADVSIDENGNSCDQWGATTDDHPECWTDGGCWGSNADGYMSDQPIAWRPV